MACVHGQLGTVAAINHPNLGPVRYRVDPVSDDPDTQVAQVIGMMSRYAREDAQGPEIQAELARIRQAGRLAPGPDNLVDSIYRHVQGRMTFMRDEATALPLQPLYEDPIVECLVRPADLAVHRGPQGDCDDYAMYTASLLTASEIPCAFVTVAADPQSPGTYSHVYLAAYPGGRRVPLDVSHGPGPGWETEHFTRRKEWPVGGCSPALLLVGAVTVAYLYLKGKP